MTGIRVRTGLKMILTSGILCMGLMLPAYAAGVERSFSDVSQDAWYAQAVAYCVENGLMSGTGNGTFSPDEAMSRGMLATVLYHMAGSPQVTWGETSPYPDVEKSAWYADAVVWAREAGVMSGYGDGRFGPDDPVTREQLATVLYQMSGKPQVEGAQNFADQDAISDWAEAAVLWARSAGILSGRANNYFDPQTSATRAEGASVLSAYDQLQLEEEIAQEPDGTESEDSGNQGGGTDSDDPEEGGGVWGIMTPNSYDSDAFVIENGFLTYQGDAPSYVGVDVSVYQGEIDWEKVAAAGVDFAMIRVGYRGYTWGTINQDTYFTANIEGALAAGLDVGVYFFSQAVTPEEAVEEARQVLEWIAGYPLTYPVVFDWERVDSENSRTKDISGEEITECAKAFCQEITQAGYLAMTYGSPSKINKDLLLDQLTDYPFWLANYTTGWKATTFPYHFQMWQYSSTGTVDGIPARVDLNICLVDWSQYLS